MSLVEVIKECQKQQLNNMQLTDIVIGTVTSKSPLEVNIDGKFPLTETQLKLTRNVTDYELEVTVEHETENHTHTHDIEVKDTYTNGGEAEIQVATHNHEYKGRKVFKVHNALEVGEKVMLIKCKGGQIFYIIDRLKEG